MLAMGGTVSTRNPRYTAKKLAYQFKNSISMYSYHTSPVTTIKEAASKSGCVEIIVVCEEGV